MSTPPPLPDPTTYPCLDAFLDTLPPLTSNPTNERKAFLAHFQREIGSVHNKVLLDIANYAVKFGIPMAVARDPLALQGSLSRQKDAVTGKSGSEMGTRTDVNPAQLRTATPAFVAPAPKLQPTQPALQSWSSQTPAHQQAGRATGLMNASMASVEVRASPAPPSTRAPEDNLSLPSQNPALQQLLQAKLQGAAIRGDVADADLTMGAIAVPQWGEFSFIPPIVSGTMGVATGSDVAIGENFSFEMGGMAPMPDRAETPAPVPKSRSASKASRTCQPRPPSPGQGSDSAGLDKASMVPAHAKALVAPQVPGPRPSLTPAPHQSSSANAQRPSIGSISGMGTGVDPNLGTAAAPSLAKFNYLPTMVPYGDNLTTQAARTAKATMAMDAETTSVYNRAGTPTLAAPIPVMWSLPHLFESRPVSATPSADSPFPCFSDTDDSGTRTPDTPLIMPKAPAPAPLLPSAGTTSDQGKPSGKPSTKVTGKRKATGDGPAGTKGPKRKKEANVYCPYCHKYFVKALRLHLVGNSECNNSDLLAIQHHGGSLAPDDTPNPPKLETPATEAQTPRSGASTVQTAQDMLFSLSNGSFTQAYPNLEHGPTASTSSLPAPKKSQSKPKKEKSFMVLMPTMAAPGAGSLPYGQPAYTHMPYGAPRD